MAKFADISVVKILTGETGLNLYQKQAQRMYDTAVVTFYNFGLQFAGTPNNWCIFHPAGSGYSDTPSTATQLTINYLPAPNPTYAFQFISSVQNRPVNNRLDGNSGIAWNQYVNDCPSTDKTNTYFSFNIDSSRGEIISILSYQDRVYPPTVATDSPIYFDDGDPNKALRASSAGNGHTNLYIGLLIIKPSAYFTALQTVTPMTCCAGLEAPQYTDPGSIAVCTDQGLIGSTSAQCINYLAQSCTGSQLLNPQCIRFCQNPNNNCDASLQALAASNPNLLQTNPDVVGCFQSQPFYTKFFDQLVAEYPAFENLPFFPYCSFPLCATATLQPFSVKNRSASACPNLTTCVSNISVNNQGNIAGAIGISSSPSCSAVTGPSPTPGPGPSPATASTGWIIGLVLGVLLLVFIVGFGIFYWRRRVQAQQIRPQALAAPFPFVSSTSAVASKYGHNIHNSHHYSTNDIYRKLIY